MMLIALFVRNVMHLNWSESAITDACDLNHAPEQRCCKLNNCKDRGEGDGSGGKAELGEVST